MSRHVLGEQPRPHRTCRPHRSARSRDGAANAGWTRTTHEPSTGATDAVKADGGRVLVVDDDPSILRMLRIVFMGDGYDVTTATNGVEALDAVQKDAPGVIVLDLEMPLMDGREFFRELRSRGHEMPVLILSAYGAERARGELKAEAFVSKPLSLTTRAGSAEAARRSAWRCARPPWVQRSHIRWRSSGGAHRPAAAAAARPVIRNLYTVSHQASQRERAERMGQQGKQYNVAVVGATGIVGPSSSRSPPSAASRQGAEAPRHRALRR